MRVINFFFLIFCIILCLIIIKFTSSLKYCNNSKWILVWNDEFEEDQIDIDKWKIEDSYINKNNEKQYYSSDEVYVNNGNLVIRSQKRNKGEKEFTSGLVSTNGKYAQMYGRFEIRAKLPEGKGIWPAHWLLNILGKWPPEIDICETYGQNKVYMTNHYESLNKAHSEGIGCEVLNLSSDFHTFALEWEPEEMRWYIDGIKKFTTNKHIPDIPFYLILNTAVGGDWPGNPDSSTKFPQYHRIDYVRIYRKDIEGTKLLIKTSKNGQIICNPNDSRFQTNTLVELTAIPEIGYKFKSWKGIDSGKNENPIKIIMDTHKIIEAIYIEDSGNKKNE